MGMQIFYRGIGAGVDVYLRTKPKAKLLLELMENFTTLGDGAGVYILPFISILVFIKNCHF